MSAIARRFARCGLIHILSLLVAANCRRRRLGDVECDPRSVRTSDLIQLCSGQHEHACPRRAECFVDEFVGKRPCPEAVHSDVVAAARHASASDLCGEDADRHRGPAIFPRHTPAAEVAAAEIRPPLPKHSLTLHRPQSLRPPLFAVDHQLASNLFTNSTSSEQGTCRRHQSACSLIWIAERRKHYTRPRGRRSGREACHSTLDVPHRCVLRS